MTAAAALWLALAAAAAAPTEPAPDEHVTIVPADPEGTTPAVVVPRTTLTEPGVTTGAALGREPGVHVSSLGGVLGLTQVRVRGAAPEQLRLSLDGVPLERADGSPVDLSELPSWQLGTLRVWRSHAPLGRGGAIGGAVELTSRRPREGLAELAAELGSFGTIRVGGYLGWADLDDRARVGLAVEHARTEGDFPWRDDGGTLFDASDDTDELRHNNHGQRTSGLASVELALGPCDASMLAHALALDRGIPGPASGLSPDVRFRRDAHTVAMRVACRARRSWSVDGVAALRWQLGRGDDPYGQLTLAPSRSRREALALSTHLTARWLPVDWLSLAAHGAAVHDAFDLSDALQPSAGAHLERWRLAAAAEVAARVPVADLDVAVRGRVDRFEDVAGGDAATTAPGWQAAVAWRGGRDHGFVARAVVGSGTRAPNLYELYGDGVAVLPSPDLRPERALSVSSSVTWAVPWLPDGWHLEAEAAGWYAAIDDLIRFRRNTLWSAVADNVAGAEQGGLELDLRADLLRHVRTRLGWTRTWTRVDSADLASHDRPMPLRPVATTRARVEGYGAFASGSELRAWVDLDHVGSNTVDAAGLVRLPARWFLGLGLGARVVTPGLTGGEGELGLGLVWSNVLDARAVDLVGYPLPGRGWTVRLSWRESLSFF